ncbi:NUDIX hydrolase [Nocardioides salsibiostraticola]
MPESKDVEAGGVVVFGPKKRVLLVHRPKYDDWSFPKGKVDPGEHPTTAAVREVAEETGVDVRLGVPLDSQRYALNSQVAMKKVHYWVGRVVGDDDVSSYVPNDEIDQVEWVEYDDALARLTYSRDVETLTQAHERRHKTRALVVLRHAHAQSRKTWTGEDLKRPLEKVGEAVAEALVPVLAAYDVRRVVSSGATRCVQTVRPFTEVWGHKLHTTRRLTEERATPARVAAVIEELAESPHGSVLCTHRPVLPLVFDHLGLKDPSLDTGEMVVVHLRHGDVVAVERHLIR